VIAPFHRSVACSLYNQHRFIQRLKVTEALCPGLHGRNPHHRQVLSLQGIAPGNEIGKFRVVRAGSKTAGYVTDKPLEQAVKHTAGTPAARQNQRRAQGDLRKIVRRIPPRSEEHTSELQSRENLVCRLLLEKKK